MSAVFERSLSTEIPVLDIDPYSVPNISEPDYLYQKLRESGPIAMIKPHGVYAVGRHEEAAQVLSDHTRFTAKGGIGIQDIRKPGDFRIPNRLLENDPPDHTKIRSALTKYLSPLVIRRWREHFEAEASILAEELASKGEFDGVEDLAEAFILKVFPESVGINLPRTEILAIGEMRFNQSGPQNELYHKAMARAQPYLEWFENSVQRKSVRPGSIAEMLFEAEDRGEFDEGIASNMVRSFVGGGTDSTIAAIGHTLNLLAQNPDQFDIVKANPARVKGAFEEAVRMEPAFRVTYRTTVAEGAELSGVKLAPNTKVGVWLGAANRDPLKWANPDKYDVTREVAGIHLGFGTGAHNCIGQMIARLESEAIISAIVRLIKRLEPAGEARYRPINQMRVLDSLPLRVTRG